MPDFITSVFVLGCLGGLLPDILRIIRNRNKPHLPTYLRKGNFWLGVLLLMAIGGITAWILEAKTAKDALIYGFASPQILSHLAASARGERGEKETASQKDSSFSLMNWWNG